MSAAFDAFARTHDLLVDWDRELEPVDPAIKHRCDACGTMRSTGALHRVYDANSHHWFRVASTCFFKLTKRAMPPELRQEAYEWKDLENDID